MSKLILSVPSSENPIHTQAIAPGQTVEFAFPVNEATFDRNGASLVVTFDGGKQVAVTDFFTREEGAKLPDIQLDDGTVIEAAAFLRDIDPNFNLAAGPAGGSAQGSGVGSYDDDSGALLGGLDRLGSLGTDYWGGEREAFSTPQAFSLSDAGGPDSSGPALVYAARAVMYVDGTAGYDADSREGYQVKAQLLFPDAAGTVRPISPDAFSAGNIVIEPVGEWDPSWGEYFFEDDRIVFSLTEDGQNALNALDGDHLLQYFTISLSKGGQNFTYTMQVVVAPARDFKSHEQDIEDRSNGGLFGQADVLYGEWHNGHGGANGNGVYTIVSSSGTDEVIINERFKGSSTLHASQQDGELTGAQDSNSIHLKQGMYAQIGEENLINSSDGVIKVDGYTSEVCGKSVGVFAVAGDCCEEETGTAVNRIEGGSSATEITVIGRKGDCGGDAGGVFALSKGAVNEVLSGSIKVTVEGTGECGIVAGIAAVAGGENTVLAREGVAQVTATATSEYGGMATGVYAECEAENTVEGEAVIIKAEVEGECGGMATGVSATCESTNNVTATTGDVTIHAISEGECGGMATGVSAECCSTNVITAAKGDMQIYVAGGMATGVSAEQSLNIISATAGTMDIQAISEGGCGGATGVSSEWGANKITAEEVLITAEATGECGGRATGVSAMGAWYAEDTEYVEENANLIKATAGNMTIHAISKSIVIEGEEGEEDYSYGGIATGVHAHEGRNAISAAGNMTIRATSESIVAEGETYGGQATAVSAEYMGANKIEAAKVVITAEASGQCGEAFGVFAHCEGTNSITTTDGGVELTATGSHAFGMRVGCYEEAVNKITSHFGDVVILATGDGVAGGMYAEGGQNIIDAEGWRVSITAQHAADFEGDVCLNRVDGLYSEYGLNSIHAAGVEILAESPRAGSSDSEDGDDSEYPSTAYGIYGWHDGNEDGDIATANKVISTKGISVTAIAGANAIGVQSEGKSENILQTSGTNKDGLLSVKAKSGDDAIGVWVSDEGRNTLVSEKGDIEVEVESNSFATGAHASSGVNELQAKNGSVTLKATGTSNDSAATGAHALAGLNDITAGGLLHIDAKSGHTAGGMDAEYGGENRINAGEVKVDAHADGGVLAVGVWAENEDSLNDVISTTGISVAASAGANAIGVQAEDKGENKLLAKGGLLYVKAESGDDALGVWASDEGSNTLVSESGDIKIEAKSGSFATAAHALLNSVNELQAENGKVTLKATSTGDDSAATGAHALAGLNDISGKHLSIEVESGHTAGGLSAEYGGENWLNATDNVDVKVKGDTLAVGVWAKNVDSLNDIITGKLEVVATSSKGDAHALFAADGDSNVTATGDTTLTADEVLEKWEEFAENGFNEIVPGGGVNIVKAKESVTLEAHAANAGKGMTAEGQGMNVVATENGPVKVTATSKHDSAYAMFADKTPNENINPAMNIILAGSGSVKLVAGAEEGVAYGMGAYGVGNNAVKADNVSIEASGGAGAIAMHAGSDGSNLIQSNGGPLILTITAKAEAGDAWAMLADKATALGGIAGDGGSNTILGSDQGDFVTLTGNIKATDGGKNKIDTGAGEDTIVINGNISGTGNLINAGDDDDHIYLNGTVESGSLVIDGGAGTDVLHLVAKDLGEFMERYGDWLSTLTDTDLMNIEKIEFQGVKADDMDPSGDAHNALLATIYNTFDSAGITVTFGAHSVPEAVAGTLALGSFSMMDLLDGGDGSPSMDALLSGLAPEAPQEVGGEDGQDGNTLAASGTANSGAEENGSAAQDSGTYSAYVPDASTPDSTHLMFMQNDLF